MCRQGRKVKMLKVEDEQIVFIAKVGCNKVCIDFVFWYR